MAPLPTAGSSWIEVVIALADLIKSTAVLLRITDGSTLTV
jgi:hypothetical protein